MHNPCAAPQAGLDLPFAPTGQARLFSWNERIGRVRYLAYSMLGIPAAPQPPDLGLKLGAALGCALLFGFIGLRFL